MQSVINTLFHWLNNFFVYLFNAFGWLLDGGLFILKFVLYSIFDGWLLIVEGFFDTLDISSIPLNALGNWGALPSQMIYVLNQICVPQAISILVGAIVVRKLLDLIPAEFTRF